MPAADAPVTHILLTASLASGKRTVETIQIDTPGLAYRHAQSDGRRVLGDTLDANTLMRWLRDSGVGKNVATDDAELLQDARELDAMIKACVCGRTAVTGGTGFTSKRFNQTSAMTRTNRDAPPWFAALLYAATGLIYIGGIAIYVRVQRRRKREQAASELEAPPQTGQIHCFATCPTLA